MGTTPNIQPLFDFVLIRPAAGEEKTESGIYLPDTAKDKPQRGTVVAVGKGAYDEDGKRMPMDVKVGDEVVYKKWGGNEVKFGNEEMMLVEQKDIMAIISK